MNKLLIVLLAICLISCAHAFVKRETTDDKGSDSSGVLKTIQDMAKMIADKIDVDSVKKSLNEGLEEIKTSLDNFKKTTGEAPKS